MGDRIADIGNMSSHGHKRDMLFRKFNALILVLCCSTSGAREDQQNISDLYSNVKDWLATTPHNIKFFFSQFFKILDNSVKLKKCSPQRFAKALMSIGQYAKHLLDQPWKHEYRNIKTYGGFFKIHIDPYTVNAIEIFELMGYRYVHALAVLVLEGDINQEAVAKVYFCCYVASCEMDIVQDISDKLAETYGTYSIQDVMRCRIETTGNVKQNVEWIIGYCKPADDYTGSKYNKFDHKLGIEDKVTTFGSSTSSNYCTDGIKSKGSPNSKQLYMGKLRKDLRKNNSTLKGPEVHLPRKDLLKHDYADPVLEGFDIVSYISGNSSDEDLYEPAELDEHLQRSLNFLNAEIEPAANSSADNYPQGGATEWDFVRVQLAKDYGNEYFEGERGDLTKMATRKNSYPRELNEVHIKSKPVQKIEVNLTPSFDNFLGKNN